MTPTQLATYIRTKTRTNSTTLTDATILSFLQVHMEALSARILELDEDYFGVVMTDDLVASDSDFDNREYALPETLLGRIKRVEAALNGTDWIKLIGFDTATYDRPTTDAITLAEFSNSEGEAFYDIFRESLWIYSGTITAGTDTLKIWAYTFPATIASMVSDTDMSVDPSTTTHGFPRILHPVLADMVVIDWKGSRPKPIPLNQQEQNIEYRTRIALRSLRKIDKDTEELGGIPSGASRGDEGYDY